MSTLGLPTHGLRRDGAGLNEPGDRDSDHPVPRRLHEGIQGSFEEYNNAVDKLIEEPPSDADLRDLWEFAVENSIWDLDGTVHEDGFDVAAELSVSAGVITEKPDLDGVVDPLPATRPRDSTGLGAEAEVGVSIAFADVTKYFAVRGKDQVHALDKVSFSVAPGEFVSIIGPSGCGKSTLLRVVHGLTGLDGG